MQAVDRSFKFAGCVRGRNRGDRPIFRRSIPRVIRLDFSGERNRHRRGRRSTSRETRSSQTRNDLSGHAPSRCLDPEIDNRGGTAGPVYMSTPPLGFSERATAFSNVNCSSAHFLPTLSSSWVASGTARGDSRVLPVPRSATSAVTAAPPGVTDVLVTLAPGQPDDVIQALLRSSDPTDAAL